MKRPNDLAEETLGEMFDIIETEFNIAARFGNIGRPEDVVPQAEADAKIDPVWFMGWVGFHVMPDVHGGIVEDVF
jgi:hypothetical protein